MKVSLVIPTYNRELDLVKCLECALTQDYKILEIILVDQTKKHNDETEDFLRTHSAQIKWLRPNFASVTKARNEGVRQSTGEIIVMIDDDTTFTNDFISQHVKAHEKYDIVQGRVVEEDSKINTHPTWVNRWLKFSGGNNCLRDGFANSITGCNFSFKRSLYDKIGPFDERFQGVAIHEDGDFGHRAWKAGYQIFYSSKAMLFHHKAMTGGVETGLERDYFFKPAYYRSELLFCKKHFSALTVWYYRLRLTIRGIKQLRKMIQFAEKEVDQLIKNS